LQEDGGDGEREAVPGVVKSSFQLLASSC